MTVELSEKAQTYLQELLNKQNVEDIGVRVYVNSPGTPQAETCLAYCKPGEQQLNDVQLDGLLFKVFLDSMSIKYLEGAKVDYRVDELGGGELTISAPNARVPKMDEDSSLSDRINYILHSEINPNLASHGGYIQFVEMAENDTIAILQFGGGCQGCGMSEHTLKQGVEETLKRHIPEIQGVRDVTDHSDTTNAYY